MCNFGACALNSVLGCQQRANSDVHDDTKLFKIYCKTFLNLWLHDLCTLHIPFYNTLVIIHLVCIAIRSGDKCINVFITCFASWITTLSDNKSSSVKFVLLSASAIFTLLFDVSVIILIYKRKLFSWRDIRSNLLENEQSSGFVQRENSRSCRSPDTGLENRSNLDFCVLCVSVWKLTHPRGKGLRN